MSIVVNQEVDASRRERAFDCERQSVYMFAACKPPLAKRLPAGLANEEKPPSSGEKISTGDISFLHSSMLSIRAYGFVDICQHGVLLRDARIVSQS